MLGVKVEVLPGRVLFTSIAHLSQPGPQQGSQDGSFSRGGGEGKPEAGVLVPGRPWATSVPLGLGLPMTGVLGSRAKCKRSGSVDSGAGGGGGEERRAQESSM